MAVAYPEVMKDQLKPGTYIMIPMVTLHNFESEVMAEIRPNWPNMKIAEEVGIYIVEITDSEVGLCYEHPDGEGRRVIPENLDKRHMRFYGPIAGE